MKTKLSLLLLIITSLFMAAQCFASDSDPIPLYPDDPTKWHGNGHRMPPAPVFCEIDYETGELISDSPLVNKATDFQLWTADNTLCLYLTDNAESLVGYILEHKDVTMILKIAGDDYVLVGYIINNE